MRAVIQRVSFCEVTIDHQEKSAIGRGLLILLGIEEEDHTEDIEWLAGKIARLRIFADTHGVMNLSVQDVSGDIMIVSQFTLHASTKKGNRPSYIRAARPEYAIPMYEKFIAVMKKETKIVPKTGKFGADMQVAMNNDGPVTIIMDSKNKE